MMEYQNTEMEELLFKDILDVFCECYNTTWERSKARPGDKLDEYLIGILENEHTEKLEIDNCPHYIIDYKNKQQNYVKEPFSTINAEHLSKKEILTLVSSKPELIL